MGALQASLPIFQENCNNHDLVDSNACMNVKPTKDYNDSNSQAEPLGALWSQSGIGNLRPNFTKEDASHAKQSFRTPGDRVEYLQWAKAHRRR